MTWRPLAECEACAAGLFASSEPDPFCYHTHPQVLVRYPLDYDMADATMGMVGVDWGVLPLLKELWDAGVRTWVSCQGNEYGGYVSYHADDHAAALGVALTVWPQHLLKATVKPIATGLPLAGRIGFPALI